ncbi:MAG: tRNA lysidine(34) synthetase TilS, partial [Bacteroidota bacterium]|nr:tRNA lysidine(34) synthetase TilS [Bacteroidota bacterium]
SGDKFKPLGMTQNKLVSDFFIDNKYTYFQKKEARVLESEGEIIWLVGERINNDYKITGSTKRILKIVSG